MDDRFLEKEVSRLILINNERRKLMANALDGLSTAFVVVGVLGQILSLSPSSASISAIIIMMGWIFGAVILRATYPWRVETVTSQEFFWYVFPWIVSAVGGAWLVYDYYKNPRHR